MGSVKKERVGPRPRPILAVMFSTNRDKLKRTIADAKALIGELPIAAQEKKHFGDAIALVIEGVIARSAAMNLGDVPDELVQYCDDFCSKQIIAAASYCAAELRGRFEVLRVRSDAPTAPSYLQLIEERLTKVESALWDALWPSAKTRPQILVVLVSDCAQLGGALRQMEGGPRPESRFREYMIAFVIALIAMLIGIPLTLWAEDKWPVHGLESRAIVRLATPGQLRPTVPDETRPTAPKR